MSNNDCESYYEEPYAGKPHVRFWKGLHMVTYDFTKRASRKRAVGLMGGNPIRQGVASHR